MTHVRGLATRSRPARRWPAGRWTGSTPVPLEAGRRHDASCLCSRGSWRVLGDQAPLGEPVPLVKATTKRSWKSRRVLGGGIPMMSAHPGRGESSPGGGSRCSSMKAMTVFMNVRGARPGSKGPYDYRSANATRAPAYRPVASSTWSLSESGRHAKKVSSSSRQSSCRCGRKYPSVLLERALRAAGRAVGEQIRASSVPPTSRRGGSGALSGVERLVAHARSGPVGSPPRRRSRAPATECP